MIRNNKSQKKLTKKFYILIYSHVYIFISIIMFILNVY